MPVRSSQPKPTPQLMGSVSRPKKRDNNVVHILHLANRAWMPRHQHMANSSSLRVEDVVAALGAGIEDRQADRELIGGKTSHVAHCHT